MSAPVAAPAQPKSTPLQWLAHLFTALGKRLLKPFFRALPPWLRYLYYLRFSILLWSFPLLLVGLNSPSAARTLISGIVTPITPLQYVCAAFFLICASFVALILAHVVVINGPERFGDNPPPLLTRLLADPDPRWEWVAPVGSQLNNALVFWYFFSNGSVEQVEPAYIRWGLLGGVVLAALFWYAMSAFYYLIYTPGPGAPAANAKTLILPRAWLRLSRPGASPGFGDALEAASLPVSLSRIAKLFPAQGFRWRAQKLNPDGTLRTNPDGTPVTCADQLYEGHFFSLVAAVGFYALYGVLWPLTAPVLVPQAAKTAIAIFCIAAAALCLLVLSANTDPDKEKKLRIWKVILAILILAFAGAIPAIYYQSDPERFPILASVLILVISASWTLGGIAFIVDRFRVPVLTIVVALVVLPRVVPGPHGKPLTGAQEEHYISYSVAPMGAALPTPGDVLDERLRIEYCGGQPCTELPKDAEPTVIVVTSTGGGIHAAAWTTAVLGNLEQQFNNQFHQHVLLLSTVSGGSVGLYDYLRELDPATNGGAPDWQRMTLGARCSSLEAVGWGLVYYDIPKAVIPFLPYFISPSSGANDLQHTPLFKDRTWSLRRAMARNLRDPFCVDWAYIGSSPEKATPIRPLDPQVHQNAVSADQNKAPDNRQELSLSRLSAIEGVNPFPAFTMNTTTVEGGNRFLLANYFVPRDNSSNPLVSKPAYSFLDLYGASIATTAVGGSVDLPLATAAQMSATFPYVSSAATLKVAPPPDAVHFVDGGYYDNDGTGSAIEFLRYALDESKLLHPKAEAGAKPATPAGNDAHTLRVLLVEIRNSPDAVVGPLIPPQDQGSPWNVVSQIVAPLQGFWSAGHESVTARNRNALGLLEGAFQKRLVLQHFIIDDQTTAHPNPPCVPPGSVATDPLNWSLTPCQQIEVDTAASESYNTAKYQNVLACFANGDSPLCPPKDEEEKHR